MKFSFCKKFGRKVWLLLIAIISFLLTALLILPMLGGIASVTGIGKPFLFVLLFFLALALAILIIIVRRARKVSRKVAPALLRYWLVLLGFSLAVNLIFNLAESINLSAARRELRAAGIPLTLKEIIPPLVSPEKNAAPTFQKAFVLVEELKKKYEQEWVSLQYTHRHRVKTSLELAESAKTFPKSPKGLRGPSKEVVQTKDLTTAQAAKLVLGNPDFQNLYKLIDRAVSFPSCRFDINYDYEQWEFYMKKRDDHISKLRDLSRLTAARTYLLAERGRYNEALESARIGLRIGDCLKSEPLVLSQLARTAVDSLGMTTFNDLLNRAPGLCSAKDYQILIQEMEKKNINAELKAGIKSHIFLNICSVFNCILQGRLTPFPDFGWGVAPDEEGRWPKYTSWITNPFSKHDFAFYLRTMKRAVEEIDKPYYQTKDFYSHLEKELTTKSKAMHHPLSMIFIAPFFGGYNDLGSFGMLMKNAMSLSNFDGFKVALALRVYKMKTGRYPGKLAALVPDILPVLPLDPFSGKDFVYRKKGTGVIVYGVGPNLADDNGRKDFKTKPASDDIVWEVK